MLHELAGLTAAQIAQLSPEELAEIAEMVERARSPRSIFDFFPGTGPMRRELYPKFMEFFAAGARHQERALIAANRCGKSICAGFELTLHATGRYPAWWIGRRFDRPIVAWACGEDVKTARDSIQKILIGPPEARGTGLIPPADLERTTARGGIPDAVDTIFVKHQRGGLSTITLKSYDSGREAFQAARIDVAWLDEEPPSSVYTEILTRTLSTTPGEPSGIVTCTFTPLLGISAVVLQFLPGGALPATEDDRRKAWGW